MSSAFPSAAQESPAMVVHPFGLSFCVANPFNESISIGPSALLANAMRVPSGERSHE